MLTVELVGTILSCIILASCVHESPTLSLDTGPLMGPYEIIGKSDVTAGFAADVESPWPAVSSPATLYAFVDGPSGRVRRLIGRCGSFDLDYLPEGLVDPVVCDGARYTLDADGDSVQVFRSGGVRPVLSIKLDRGVRSVNGVPVAIN